MSGLLKKLTSGGGPQKSRLHDNLGNRVPASRLLKNGTRALATTLARKLFDVRPVRPWISYDGQARLAALLTSKSRVLEFGSGMSTVWYAQRAGEVISVEDYGPWFDKVAGIVAERGVTNLNYRFVEQAADYATLPSGLTAEGFDLIMIDGSWRDTCAQACLGWVRPGGVIYLDNADKTGVDITGDIANGRRLLLEHAKANGWTVDYYTDFAPCQAFVEQGMAIRRPA